MWTLFFFPYAASSNLSAKKKKIAFRKIWKGKKKNGNLCKKRKKMLSFSYLWLIILKYVPLVLKGQLEHEESNFLDYQPGKKMF